MFFFWGETAHVLIITRNMAYGHSLTACQLHEMFEYYCCPRFVCVICGRKSLRFPFYIFLQFATKRGGQRSGRWWKKVRQQRRANLFLIESHVKNNGPTIVILFSLPSLFYVFFWKSKHVGTGRKRERKRGRQVDLGGCGALEKCAQRWVDPHQKLTKSFLFLFRPLSLSPPRFLCVFSVWPKWKINDSTGWPFACVCMCVCGSIRYTVKKLKTKLHFLCNLKNDNNNNKMKIKTSVAPNKSRKTESEIEQKSQ